jgi:hypothetical protein
MLYWCLSTWYLDPSLIDWLITSYPVPAVAKDSYAGVSASRRTALGLANVPHFIMWPWPATSSTAWSGFYLRLCTYPFLEVLCVCPIFLHGSLTAASAIHLVSSYLQSFPSTSIWPSWPFLESQPLCLCAEFLCSSVFCIKYYSWNNEVLCIILLY